MGMPVKAECEQLAVSDSPIYFYEDWLREYNIFSNWEQGIRGLFVIIVHNHPSLSQTPASPFYLTASFCHSF